MEGIDKRTKILEYSLMLEEFVSYELAHLLDITNFKTSKSLGNTASSLSINQKLNLLLDVENITKREKTTIENFMSIRNQFMHNIDAISYSYVINKIDGLENKLKKQYSNAFNGINKEEAFELCVMYLFKDSLKILQDKKGNKLRKIKQRIAVKSYEILKEKFEDSYEKQLKILEDFFENYPENKIEKNVISFKISLMDIEIKKDLINNKKDEIIKLQKPE
ncbi:MAG: hypothetical protein GQ564_03765 [Bacteroidales bacterium]|nr:hypothetical protein [Bacteroidales bacterium]